MATKTVVLAQPKNQEKLKQNFLNNGFDQNTVFMLGDNATYRAQGNDGRMYNNPLLVVDGFNGMDSEGTISVLFRLNVTALYRNCGVSESSIPTNTTPDGMEGNAWASGVFPVYPDDPIYPKVGEWVQNSEFDERNRLIYQRDQVMSSESNRGPLEFKLSSCYVVLKFNDERMEGRNGGTFFPLEEVAYHPSKTKVVFGQRGLNPVKHIQIEMEGCFEGDEAKANGPSETPSQTEVVSEAEKLAS